MSASDLVYIKPPECVCGNIYVEYHGPCHEICKHCDKIAINPAEYNCCRECICGKIIKQSDPGCHRKCRCGNIYEPDTYIFQCGECFGKECENRSNNFHIKQMKK